VLVLLLVLVFSDPGIEEKPSRNTNGENISPNL